MKFRQLSVVVVCSLFISYCFGFSGGYDLGDYDFPISTVSQDTIPLSDRFNDFITDDKYNPFDIQTREITQEVEYDPQTGNYIILEKIGEEYFRTPSYMTFEEYLEYQSKKSEQEYFGKLAGITTGQKSDSGKVDPMSKIELDKALLDRMFGGNEITIEPQGNIDLTFGLESSISENATLTQRQQNQGILPDFDMGIQLSVDGKIGEKLNLGFNYDTEASFDFDRKIKLEYDTELFSEDDIIKKIEAGNVSLPLRSNLIQGAQSLFGLKTELQFGRLRVTGLLSQQRSNQETLTIEGGALKQEVEILPTDYDENRHFFLSHYFRDNYEDALKNLPYLNTLANITNVEVWVSNFRNDNPSESRQICAISDMGEPNENGNFDENFHQDPMMIQYDFVNVGTQRRDENNNIIPDNGVSTLYGELAANPDTRLKNVVASNLTTNYRMQENRDFETFRGRKLNSNEFTYHPQLGFISLNIRLRTDQVLAVAYEYNYTYCDAELFKVGEPTDVGATSSVEENEDEECPDVSAERVIYTKLLKGSNQRVSLPSWDLMMKNVYSVGTSQLNPEDFKFDIFFQDNTDGSLKRFLPEGNALDYTPLLNLFDLDKLNASLDPQPDGVFDFIDGVTVNNRTGSIYYPKLEPFGNALDSILGPTLAAKYKFEEIYDSTLVGAQTALEKNLFVMKVEYKSSVSSEISLGSWNLPQGSVKVTSGSTTLKEGIDYEVDYGIGRLRIINPSYLQSGAPIRVSFEDNSLFSLQQKTMIGMRADYTFSEHLNVGATYLKLKERPFTQKVNVGEDPINNRVLGLDLTYGKKADWVTKAVDKLPFYSTKEESNINFTAEIAGLKPGHSNGIDLSGDDPSGNGVVSIDDFEGAGSPIPIGNQVNNWVLASTPNYGDEGLEIDPNNPSEGYRWREGILENDLAYGYNRALMNWYVIDRSNRTAADQNDPYTRTIDQRELFERELAFQITDLFTFDVNYFPDERGPYNFETSGSDYSDGIDVEATNETNGDIIKLENPESRWGGIMRYLNNNDFQTANIEYLDFWMLNPYLERRDGSGHIAADGTNEEGELIFHLGNISEDILRDNLQFFENSIAVDSQKLPVETTVWGDVPDRVPNLQNFNVQNAPLQDLGLDGLADGTESERYQMYLDTLAGLSIPTNRVNRDPANDNFGYINDSLVLDIIGPQNQDNLIYRSKYANNPQGNYPDNTNSQIGFQIIRGNPLPDKEDLNGNSSLGTGESFYEYRLPLKDIGGEVDIESSKYWRETKEIINGNMETEQWYRFQIPIATGRSVNGIEGFRSIQFMRMIATGFNTQKTFRFAEMEFVRNTWRRQAVESCFSDGAPADVDFAIDDVGVQENPNKLPFNYVLPPGIKQEQLFSSTQSLAQDERALVVRACNLPANNDIDDFCDAAVFKNIELDLRVFENLELFVHAENSIDPTKEKFDDRELSLFIKVGKDYVNNYYEYEIPLKFSDINGNISDVDNVWPEENIISFSLDEFTELKKLRNASSAAPTDRFSDGGNLDLGEPRLTIKGLPSLGFVKGIEIGIRNRTPQADNRTFCGEVWLNELRLTGLQERGGMAAEARLEVQMADLGSITSSAGFSSIGWGALDKKVDERAKESVLKYDVATDINLGKFFPKNWNLRVPFYAQYARNVVTPEFDAYELDLTLDETLDPIASKERSQEVETIKTFNFTNVRKEKGKGKGKAKTNSKKKKKAKKSKTKSNSPKPWDISNITASYAHTEIERKDFLIKQDKTKDQRLKLEYNFSNRSNFIKPFKKVKGKWLKVIKEINFSPLPSSFYVNSEIRRFSNTREFREPDNPQFVFDDKRFTWDRNYGLKWDFFKNLKFNFDASNKAVIDELRQTGIAATPEERPWLDVAGNEVEVNNRAEVEDYWKDNIRDFGRNKSYQHKFDVSYTAPLKYIPATDWITVKARYNGNYKWNASSLDFFDEDGVYLGDVIENGQQRTVNASFAFDQLYKKSKFLKEVERKKKRKKKKKKDDKDKKKERTDVDLAKKDKKKDPKDPKNRKKTKKKGSSTLAKVLVRPLLSLRKVKFNYRENLSTIVPGITQENSPSMLGLSSGFDAPGWAFVSGWQPDLALSDSRDNWLHQAANNGWITDSKFLNNQVSQKKTQTYDLKIDIEPYRDLKLTVDFKKQFTNDLFENFKDSDVASNQQFFEQLGRREVGSFELTYSGLNTFFNNDVEALFDEFKSNRSIVSNILNPGGEEHEYDGNLYNEGYGAVQSEVILPSFIAAYIGREIDPSWIQRDVGAEATSGLIYEVSRNSFLPRPNWTLRYNGLKNLPMFENILSQFTLTHSYKGTLRVNQFRSNLDFEADGQDQINVVNGNYYSRFEIPLVQLSEQFSPLIGIQLKTKKDFVFNLDYKKSRSLDLSTDVLGRLSEKRSTGITVGMGWTKQNVNIGFLTGDKKGKKKKQRKDKDGDDKDKKEEDKKAEDKKKQPNRGLGRNNVNNNRPRDMTFNVDFSLQDDITYEHEYIQGLVDSDGNRGQKSIRFNPSVDYNINENLTLRLFFNYETTLQVASITTRFTRYYGGLTARFNLQ